jgi:AmiR/NasT family two-component response regulator
VIVTFHWDREEPIGREQVETAVGVLMELRGWDPPVARARLILAAVRADAPVESLAQAILSLYP